MKQQKPTTYYYGGPSPYFEPETIAVYQQKKIQKKAVTRVGNAVGAGMLLVQAFGLIVLLVLPTLMDAVFPLASQVGGVYYDALEYMIFSCVCLLLSFFLASFFGKRRLEDLFCGGKASLKVTSGCILFGYMGVFIGNLVGTAVTTLFPAVEQNVADAMITTAASPMELLVSVLYMAAIPALVEEFAFRGVVLGLLRPYGDRFAVVVSSLMFALLHGNFLQIPFAFFVGLTLAYATVRTHNIGAAVLIHFLNNGLACVLDYYGEDLQTLTGGWYVLGLYALWLLLGLSGYLLLRIGTRQKIRDCYRPYAGPLTLGGRVSGFLRAPTVIVTLVIYLLSASILAIPGMTT